ncbi:MAG: MotA/TolQ/ExbB proton channel family protein [Candidatus Zixiibacteriota bacterium]
MARKKFYIDLATFGGLVIGVGAILVAYFIDGGRLQAITQAAPMLLVIGGTFGAAMITTSFNIVKKLPTLLKIAFFRKSPDSRKTIDLITKMAEKARREGVLGLERDLPDIEDGFFKKAIQLVIDGTEATTLRQILHTEVNYMFERHRVGIGLFKALGGFSPTMGIIGTVLGLIHTLSNTSDAGKMAIAIAGAFIATLWGIAMANIIYLPIGDKLRFRHDEESSNMELIIEGVIAIQSGDNPRIIRTRLMSFITPELRTEKSIEETRQAAQQKSKMAEELIDMNLRRKKFESLLRVDK